MSKLTLKAKRGIQAVKWLNRIRKIKKQIDPSEKTCPVWFISERGFDARDNGFVFYQYVKREHPEIRVFYGSPHKVGNTGVPLPFYQ